MVNMFRATLLAVALLVILAPSAYANAHCSATCPNGGSVSCNGDTCSGGSGSVTCTTRESCGEGCSSTVTTTKTCDSGGGGSEVLERDW